MEEEYDVIIMGTGLNECVISGLLSMSGYKVLHLERNDYYGGEGASLRLDELYRKFRPEVKPDYEKMGKPHEYNIDLIPKFVMSRGKLIDLIISSGVKGYIQVMQVSKCFIMGKEGNIFEVPSDPLKLIGSSLGVSEKNNCRKLLSYIQNYDENKPGKTGDLKMVKINELYKKFGIEDEEVIEFFGHAIALETNSKYLEKPAFKTAMKMKICLNSFARYGGDSPFLYPVYGITEFAQAFARLSAVHGAGFLTKTNVQKVHYENEKVIGVETEKYPGRIAKCKFVVGDPSYFPEKVERKRQIIRSINILSHPVECIKKPVDSFLIVIPHGKANRKHDIYISSTSGKYKVCPKGKYIAIVSTTVETSDPLREIQPALDLLGEVDEQFVNISDYYEPIDDEKDDGVFISKSFDETINFENCMNNIISIFERITKKPFDWKKKIEKEENDSKKE